MLFLASVHATELRISEIERRLIEAATAEEINEAIETAASL